MGRHCPFCGAETETCVKIRFDDEELTVMEMADRLADYKRRGTMRGIYDAIMDLQTKLAEDHDDPVFCKPDHRKIQALAATYTLQEYLANEIAAAVDAGELEPDMEE